jgi:hypothetical protein
MLKYAPPFRGEHTRVDFLHFACRQVQPVIQSTICELDRAPLFEGCRTQQRSFEGGDQLHQIRLAIGSGFFKTVFQMRAHGRLGYSELLSALLLTAGARRRTGHAFAAVAGVFVHKAALEAPSAAETLISTYKLTAMELRGLPGGTRAMTRSIADLRRWAPARDRRRTVRCGARCPARAERRSLSFSSSEPPSGAPRLQSTQIGRRPLRDAEICGAQISRVCSSNERIIDCGRCR